MKKEVFYLAFGIILVAIIVRVIPHPANFAPVGAVAIFSGRFLPKRYAYIIPVLIMFLSDLIVGFYTPLIMASVYVSFLISVWLGSRIKSKKLFAQTLTFTLLGSVIFFLITNTAVWAFSSMYPHTLIGLAESYWLALPFFRNTVLSDIFYVGVLFTSFALFQKKSFRFNSHQIIN